MVCEKVNNIITNHLCLKNDPLFAVIKRNKVTSSLYKEIAFLNHCASVLALVSAIIGLISIFYEAKAHLQIMGIASIFHILGSLAIESCKKRQNRYLLLFTGLCNVIFFGVSQIFLTLFILVGKLLHPFSFTIRSFIDNLNYNHSFILLLFCFHLIS